MKLLKNRKFGHAPICVFASNREVTEGLVELAHARQISSTVLSSTAEIQSDIPPLFFKGGDRQLAAELDFATHLFIILGTEFRMNKPNTE